MTRLALRLPFRLALLCPLLLAACVSPLAVKSDTDTTLSPTATSPCLLLAGGRGVRFAEEDINDVWLEASRRITEHLYKLLRTNGYASEVLVVGEVDQDRAVIKVLDALGRTQCGQLVEVTYRMTKMAVGQAFTFELTVLRHPPRVGGSDASLWRRTMVPEYKKIYRQNFLVGRQDHFLLDAFARQLFEDLERSGTLTKTPSTTAAQ